MTISIITATYNSGATIESCMHSVLQQSYPALEYIIMDGGSEDGTLKIIKRVAENYPKTSIKIVSESDGGIYDALNKGITKATGDIIGFVHSDDLLASTTILEEIANNFSAHNVDGIYGDLIYVNAEDPTKVIRNWQGRPFKFELLRKGWMPAHPTLYLKRDIYLNEGHFNTKLKIAADYDFILRIFKNESYSWHYLPKIICKMRMGGASNRSVKNIMQKSKEDYRVLKKHKISRSPLNTLMLKNLSKIRQFFIK